MCTLAALILIQEQILKLNLLGKGKNPMLGVSSYFHIHGGCLFGLGHSKVKECPAGLENWPAGARNTKKITVKIRRNPQFRIFPVIQFGF